MALRLRKDPVVSPRSAKVGDIVVVTLRVENTEAAGASVGLFVEGLPPESPPWAFDPPAATVPPRGRATLSFAWRAALPEGREALTYRGRLVVKELPLGRLVAHAPLDVYVGRG